MGKPVFIEKGYLLSVDELKSIERQGAAIFNTGAGISPARLWGVGA
jgi:hypothetical protein